MKAIIFGVRGQDGFYLSELLRKNNVECFGIARTDGDIGDYGYVANLMKQVEPDYVFHLAANSTTRHEAIFDNHRAISTGTINILESVRLHCAKARVFLSGSAMQFKNDGQPIDENTPFAASSPYSVSRIESVYAGRYFRSAFGMKIYAGYFFNHDSPLRGEKHVNQIVASSAKRIAKGSTEKLELGNMSIRKEFNFAGDVVDAIWMLVNQERVFEAVIGSGKAFSIRDWVDQCFRKVGRNWEDHVVQKAHFASEYEILVSNPTLMKSLGWEPKVDLEQLADLMMANS